MGEASRRRSAGIVVHVGHGHASTLAAALTLRALAHTPVLVVEAPAPAHKPDKGKKGGSCNREACQAPHAVWFNSGTRAFYCARCAHLINRAGYDNDRAYGREPTPICTREEQPL